MTTIHPDNVDKPVETIHKDSIEGATPEIMGNALEAVVDHSATQENLGHGIHAPFHKVLGVPYLKKVLPGLENLAAKHHVGNYVVIRGTNEKFFESMPIYARIGMHLLFYGHENVKLLEGNKEINNLLKNQSIKVCLSCDLTTLTRQLGHTGRKDVR